MIEVLVIVVILGILAAVVVPRFAKATEDSRAGNLKAQLKILQGQIDIFAGNNGGTFPAFPLAVSASYGWDDLVTGDYIKAIPVNPAGTDDGLRMRVLRGPTGTGHNSAGWFFNETDSSLYASYFDETNDVMTTSPAN